MSFKIGLSSNPGKDKGKAEAAMKGDQNFKDALKEVLSEIGHCFENAQLIDQRVKANTGKAAFEEQKRKAMEGNADIKALARALGFEVMDDDEDDDEDSSVTADDAEDSETTAETATESDDDDDGGDFDFNFDDDASDGDAGDGEKKEEEEGDADFDFNFDDDED